MKKKIKIGVFDSGVGGLSIALAILNNISHVEVIFINDADNVPYGNKTNEQLINLVLPKFDRLINEGCQIIVVACNTLTTNLISKLRQVYQVPLVGVEPMVKPASLLSKTKTIGMLATPSTLNSNRYKVLKEEYATDIIVVEPDCSEWSSLIENNQNIDIIRDTIEDLIRQKADVIVLACTHYHWIENEIKKIVGKKALLLQPEDPILDRINSIIDTQLRVN